MNYSYIYTVVLFIVAFMVTNLMLNKPVTSMGMEPIIAAVFTGSMSYYYFNIYNKNTIADKTTPALTTDRATPIQATPPKVTLTPVTSEGQLEKVQQGPFSTA